MAANPPVDKTTPPPYPPPPYSGEPYQSQQPPYTPYPPYPGAPYPVDGSQQAPVVAPPTLPSYTVPTPSPPNTYRPPNYGSTGRNVNVIATFGPAFVVATPTPLGPQSTQVLCPTCRIMVFTEVSYESGFLAWICCFFIFILGGVWGCCLIPFCIESCQDVYHRCPSCHGLLGVYSRH
uniref:Lipopolysaccharide-induced tumor necrosis factor-alpha factor homolog n=1 Tax=Schistocephalus solidus TaxID=70667 RepID=A0A0X3Q988_SCHSO